MIPSTPQGGSAQYTPQGGTKNRPIDEYTQVRIYIFLRCQVCGAMRFAYCTLRTRL